MHDGLRAAADALEPDRHCEAAACLQRVFGQRRGALIDVPIIDVVADFEKRSQHREQDRAGIHHARGKIVGAAAQKPSRDPEGERRNAVAVEDPVENGCGADIRNDARLVRDAHHHQRDQDAAQPAQPRQRPFRGDPCGARHRERKRDREPALLEREGERERECRNRAGGKDRRGRRAAGAGFALCQHFGCDREQRGEQQREGREG